MVGCPRPRRRPTSGFLTGQSRNRLNGLPDIFALLLSREHVEIFPLVPPMGHKLVAAPVALLNQLWIVFAGEAVNWKAHLEIVFVADIQQAAQTHLGSKLAEGLGRVISLAKCISRQGRLERAAP